jgi:hypothetical protein
MPAFPIGTRVRRLFQFSLATTILQDSFLRNEEEQPVWGVSTLLSG